VHLAELPLPDTDEQDPVLEEKWSRLRMVRDEVMRALEEARRSKLLGNALEAELVLYGEGEWADLLETYRARLADIMIVSQVTLVSQPLGDEARASELPELQIQVKKATGKKCERCWKWLPSVGQDPRHPDACHTCTQILLHT
jgi:isoleucyl-tRNA synthetase